ncbi:hypothetical protein [Burkholderia pseudomallei]|nr:hypothetical protein [Burkholderia pseudomallei]
MPKSALNFGDVWVKLNVDCQPWVIHNPSPARQGFSGFFGPFGASVEHLKVNVPPLVAGRATNGGTILRSPLAFASGAGALGRFEPL